MTAVFSYIYDIIARVTRNKEVTVFEVGTLNKTSAVASVITFCPLFNTDCKR